MTDAERILALSALLDGTGIGLLELTTPDGTIRLRRGAGPLPMQEAPPASGPIDVNSPGPGIFRTAHPALVEPLARPERRVAAGEAIGLVQVGPLLLHVVAPASGTVLAPVAADGDLVGFGTMLLRMTEDRG